MGVNCIQGAALAGAGLIAAIDLAPAKLATASAFGATHVVDAANEDVPPRASAHLTDGRGVDCAVVATGATAAVEEALQIVRRGGTVVIVGMPAGGATIAVDTAALAHDGVRILGSKLGSSHPVDRRARPRRAVSRQAS